MAYLQRALQNYQHQHIETCTKFTNVQFFLSWNMQLWFLVTKKKRRERIEK